MNFLISLTLHNLIMAALCWVTGVWVLRCRVKVNYTRKINHFALTLIPFALAPFFPYQANVWTISTSLLIFLLSTSILSEPVRTRFSMAATAFASIDRPEDRPHTIRWIISQAVVSALVLAVFFLLLLRLGWPTLISIPLVVNGLGDGLAEPIGVRFGRHRYRVPSLVPGRFYDRSIEGSACVAIVSVLTIVALMPTLTFPLALGLLITIPPVATITEAFSPHAWDAPLLYGAIGAVTALVVVVTT